MKWYEFADNPRAITALYAEVPELEQVHLLEVAMDNRRMMTVTVALPDFPDQPPPNWRWRNYTAIHLCLQFEQVRDFHLEGWASHQQADLSIEKTEDQQISFHLKAAQCCLQAVAGSFRITLIKQ
jgi:hypothetical protein